MKADGEREKEELAHTGLCKYFAVPNALNHAETTIPTTGYKLNGNNNTTIPPKPINISHFPHKKQ
jgi:hypothetical protein